MTSEPDADRSVIGEILAHGRNFRQLHVRLDDGREVVAVLPKTRKFGCLFGSLVGWKVRVAFLKPPKAPRIVELLGRPNESLSG